MAERTLALGRITLDDGWDVSAEAMLRAPVQTVAAGPLAARASTVLAEPRPSLIVQRRPAPPEAEDFLALFLESAAAASSGLTAQKDDAGFTFADGAHGKSVRVSLATEPPTEQLHVVRIDDGVMTHFVLAARAGDTAAFERLRAAAASWRP